jgi:hypothetical protein
MTTSNDVPTPKREYWLLDTQRKPLGQRFRSRSPQGAALKAAIRGHTEIVLFLDQTLWQFKGERFPAKNRQGAIFNPPPFALKNGPTDRLEAKAELLKTVSLDPSEAESIEQECWEQLQKEEQSNTQSSGS